MQRNDPSPGDSEHQVVSFRSGRPLPSPPAPAPVEDLAKYQRSEAPDDYRHRMIVNVAAFVFVVGLIGAGLWLADTMARLRKDQDCALTGRRGCMPVEVRKDRW